MLGFFTLSQRDRKMARAVVFLYIVIVPMLVFFCNGALPPKELKALKGIAAEVGKTDWNFSIDPCSNHTSWSTPKSDDRPLYNNTLVCNCSFPRDRCHVVSIFLKGQDLQGVLPRSIAKLPYLKNIDLTRNYLSGNIPPEWASTKLEYFSVFVNNLTGPIPGYLGNISSLVFLNLHDNMFSGTVPPELGNLVHLETLLLSGNNLTGELPVALTKLTKLTQLQLSSNYFTGRIPDYFKSWINLETLEIQGSGLRGPIPASISVLSKLRELRISDVYGGASEFPPLSSMKGMKELILRSCDLSGLIPSYMLKMTNLSTLDLSFNRLEGKVPDLSELPALKYMFFTSNLLTGPIPGWMKSRDQTSRIDISYNKFSESSDENTCSSTMNLFKSSGTRENSSLFGDCMDDYVCTEDRYALAINCGGKATTIGAIKYEGDQDDGGPAKIDRVSSFWGFSSTGNFLEDKTPSKDYIARNQSVLSMKNSELYTSARLSPLSLTYYGRCLGNGKYKVKLHFAEIMFRGNHSFYGLGRRLFDVYVQEKLVIRDFDIEKEAHGVDKEVTVELKGVQVQDRTIMIRFHWSGKGTTGSPERGVYGPLISALSVSSEFEPPHHRKSRRGLLIGAVVGSATLCLACLIFGLFWWKVKASKDEALSVKDLQAYLFSYNQIRAATNNFNAENKIGEGGFGAVYKGTLSDGTLVAVKQLSSTSKQGNREFVTEVGTLTALQHPNLVKLYGCCIEGKQLMLVYEFMANNNLARALYGSEEGDRLQLDWPIRLKICLGIATGLAYLHEELALHIVHRDIKTTNVLLDRELQPKIADFGLAKLDEGKSHVSTRPAGTLGYLAPEYAQFGRLSMKADVYSFGVVALELVAGQNTLRYRSTDNPDISCLVDWALVFQRQGNLMELVDSRLGSSFDADEIMKVIKVGLLCTNQAPALRPSMSSVVSMLEGQIDVPEPTLPALPDPNENLKTIQEIFESSESESERSLIAASADAIDDGSSTSTSTCPTV